MSKALSAAVLVFTFAAGALSLAFGGPALATLMPVLPAGCTIDSTGTIETCIGDQHTGVTALSPPVTTLNVNSLTTAITPASGTNGITFTSAGAVTINSDTGAFGITTQGKDLSDLQANVREAVRCHFGKGKAPRTIRLHFVTDPVVATT